VLTVRTSAGTSTASVCSPMPQELLPAVSGTADNLPEPYQPPPSTAATSDDGIPIGTNGTFFPPPSVCMPCVPCLNLQLELRCHCQA
jgi:hypothetical protein